MCVPKTNKHVGLCDIETYLYQRQQAKHTKPFKYYWKNNDNFFISIIYLQRSITRNNCRYYNPKLQLCLKIIHEVGLDNNDPKMG